MGRGALSPCCTAGGSVDPPADQELRSLHPRYLNKHRRVGGRIFPTRVEAGGGSLTPQGLAPRALQCFA